MKRTLSIAVAAMILLTVLASSPAFAQADKDVIAAANPIIDTLTKGMETTNYDMYMGPWTPACKQAVTKDKFSAMAMQVNSTVGKLQKKTFFSVMDSKGYKVVQWKGKFSNVPQELYIWLFLKNVDGKYMCEGHWIRNEAYK